MLALQKYLRSGKSLHNLKEDYAVNSYRHPTLPLIGFKYDMIDSPKAEIIVRESRGIVLEDITYSLIGYSFPRFFNLGEMPELVKNFDWNTFRADSKLDGSLQIQFFYAGEWHVNTSGSFGLAECNYSGKTWRELFWSTLGKDPSVFDQFKHLTLVWELWTPWNKVVTTYPKSAVTLLGAFEVVGLEDPRELRPSTVDHIAAEIGVARPISYNLKSVDEVTKFIKELESKTPTDEGLVLRDCNNLRIKVKSSTYLAYHRLKGDTGFSPKNLVPLILAGETSEVEAVFPEVKEILKETKLKVEAAWLTLESVWKQFYKIENQKEFALSIIKLCPFSSLLFSLRKQKGSAQTLEDLKFLWRDSADLIVKVLFA